MYSHLARLLTVVAFAGALTACGSGDTVDDLESFCDAKVALDRVEQEGNVGDFGPALEAFSSQLPDNATDEVSRTAKNMTASWDALYDNYTENGGDPRVKLLVDGQVPPEIAGMRAEWTQGLSRSAVKQAYDFAEEECSRDR